MAQRILGLDIGARNVRAILLEGTQRSWKLRAFASAPLEDEPAAGPAPAPEPEAEVRDGAADGQQPAAEAAASPTENGAETPGDPRLARALASIAEQIGGLRADFTAVAYPGAGAASPQVALPFTDHRKIEATLAFEVEGLLPFDIDEAHFDYQPLAQRDGKSELLVGVVRRDEFERLLGQLQGAGLDPRVVTLPGLALERIATGIAAGIGLAPEEQIALLDIGHDRSVLSVVRGAVDEKSAPSLVFTRTFAAGAFGTEAADRLSPVALQRLVREVRQSLRASQTRTRREVSRIYLGGSLAVIPGVAERLAAELHLPVEPVALPDDAGAKIPAEEQPLWAEALGLALRAMSRGGKLLNLRRGPYAYRGDLDFLKGKSLRLVAFAAVLALLVAANFWARLQTLETREADLDAALCQVTQRVLGSCETDFNVAVSKLQGGGSEAARIPTASALEVFSEAIAAMPGEVGLRLDELDVSLDRLRLRGVVDSFEGVDQVVGNLSQSRCIGEVRRGRVQRTRDEKIEFTLDALYVCGQNADNSGASQEG